MSAGRRREGDGGGTGTSLRCPLCEGAATRAFFAADLNRGSGRERFEYARCETCATYFQPHPPEDLSPYYPREYYELPSLAELDRLAESQAATAQTLRERVGPGRLIEIGPGEGVFARAALDAGFEVSAIEMDARACAYLRDVAGVDAIESERPEQAIAELPPSRAVVMWHVIEHLRRPWEVIERAAANLLDGGVLAIATPNPAALQFKLLGRRWAHLDAPRHLFLIPADTLADRCSQLRLQLVSTTTSDAAGRHWNRFGWQYALRRAPRSRPATRLNRISSGAITRALSPIETRGLNGCAYASIFVKLPPP